jgi:hypothetical protein
MCCKSTIPEIPPVVWYEPPWVFKCRAAAAPRFRSRIRSRTRVSQLRVHRSRRLPSRARVRSRVVGRTALKTAGLWCTVLVGGRPNEMEGESARPVRGVSRQQFTNDEAAAHPPPPRHLRLLRRRVRARAADGLADGAADPVRPACHPAADRGPTVCGAGSTHVHRAIDARTGRGAPPLAGSSSYYLTYILIRFALSDGGGLSASGLGACVPRARQQRKPALKPHSTLSRV